MAITRWEETTSDTTVCVHPCARQSTAFRPLTLHATGTCDTFQTNRGACDRERLVRLLFTVKLEDRKDAWLA